MNKPNFLNANRRNYLDEFSDKMPRNKTRLFSVEGEFPKFGLIDKLPKPSSDNTLFV